MTYIKNNINLIAQFNELKNTYSNVSTTIIKVIEQSVMTKFLLSIPSYFHTISASTKTDLCHQRLNLFFPETDVKCMVSYIFFCGQLLPPGMFLKFIYIVAHINPLLSIAE